MLPFVTDSTQDPLLAFLHASDHSLWSTAALILSLSGGGSEALQGGAADVLRTLVLSADDARETRDAQ